ASTPREQRDAELERVRPHKVDENSRKVISTWPGDEAPPDAIVATFAGSAKIKQGFSASGAVLWKLPQWEVITQRRFCTLNANKMVLERGIDRRNLIGDSRLVIQQMRGDIDCKACWQERASGLIGSSGSR
ncbi:TPA: hypothetical protein N0F65_003513, partial [Lagenidium giganteum]